MFTAKTQQKLSRSRCGTAL